MIICQVPYQLIVLTRFIIIILFCLIDCIALHNQKFITMIGILLIEFCNIFFLLFITTMYLIHACISSWCLVFACLRCITIVVHYLFRCIYYHHQSELFLIFKFYSIKANKLINQMFTILFSYLLSRLNLFNLYF